MKALSGIHIGLSPLLVVLAGIIPAATIPSDAIAAGDAVESGREIGQSASAILKEAFRNRYEVSFTTEIEMLIGLPGGQSRRRVLDVATLHDPDTYRAMGQLTFPEYLRGMTILTISEAQRLHQAFVYLPSQSRVRRISITHKDDAFLGSDLTYEDFERRHVEDCELALLQSSTVQGEEVYVVECIPVAKLNYDRAEFSVAKSDFAILEIREYRGEKDVLSRRMTAPRGGMQLLDGHVLATRFDFETPKRKTVTRVTFKDLRAQRIDHRLFTVNALERKAELKRAMAAKDGS